MLTEYFKFISLNTYCRILEELDTVIDKYLAILSGHTSTSLMSNKLKDQGAIRYVHVLLGK
jgi:hypothetical protein